MDWKHITPEMIRSGKAVVTSAEMSEEVNQYNISMRRMKLQVRTLRKLEEIYKLLNIVAFTMVLCIFLKPVLFDGAGGRNHAAIIISFVGYVYILTALFGGEFRGSDKTIKYNGRSLFSHRSHYSKGFGEQEMKLGLSIGSVVTLLCGFALAVGGGFVLGCGYTVNKIVSIAAFAVCIAAFGAYVFFEKRRNVTVSVLGGAAYVLASPLTAVFTAFIIITAVKAEWYGNQLRGEEGYPLFAELEVFTEMQGCELVASYDDFNRFDGIDDEMESI